MPDHKKIQDQAASINVSDRIVDRLGFLMAVAWLDRIGPPPHGPEGTATTKFDGHRRGIESDDARPPEN